MQSFLAAGGLSIVKTTTANAERPATAKYKGILSSPATPYFLSQSMKSSKAAKMLKNDSSGGRPKNFEQKLLRVLGPSLITDASDDDPSGIATYSQAGAQFGFSIAWTLLFTYPLMSAIQEISGRIGRTTGKGIAANLRQHYPIWLLQSIVGLYQSSY